MRCFLLLVVAVFTLTSCASNQTGYKKDRLEPKKSVLDLHKKGSNKDGYDKYGYDKNGFNMQGIHINTGTEFNEAGYNVNGEKGSTLTFTKDNSYNVFSVVSIKIDGQPIALNEKRVVLNGTHLIEAQTSRDKKGKKLQKHSESVNLQYDMTIRISDYGIYF